MLTVRQLGAIEQRLSVERMAPYRAAVFSGDMAAAIALYEWNAQLSAVFWPTIGHVEVLLRNSLHEQLSAWSAESFGELRWYLDPSGRFEVKALADIDTARRRVTRSGKPEVPGRVVAELSLGFWRFLLASRYDRSLWIPALRKGFSFQGGDVHRRDLHSAVTAVNNLRNRIAHHEPIHHQELERTHKDAITIARWICPDTARWILRNSQVPAVLKARPSRLIN